MTRFLSMLLVGLFSTATFSWNAMGHQLVAQIAYDNLNPQAKKKCTYYHQQINKVYHAGNFVAAATWLDVIRKNDNHWYDSLHYIDIPFSNDATSLPPTERINALWGINNAIAVLVSPKATASDKGLSLRILTHVVGDIHQPLHTAALISQALPKGDLGGNLFPLGKNYAGANLHSYWDNGAGALLGKRKKKQILIKARQLEAKWSCAPANHQSDPEQWVKESHQLAITAVYQLKPGSVPSKNYRFKAQQITEKQIHTAGCRLAALLNKHLVS